MALHLAELSAWERHMNSHRDVGEVWPALPYDAWKDTCDTLHLYTQIVGKIRLCCAPHINHWWQVPLYVSSRGLTTSLIPYRNRAFEIAFDFIAQRLAITTSDGRSESFSLEPRAVADFYSEIMARLRALDLDIRIWTMPVEIPNPIRFEEDREHHSYDAEQAHRFWCVLRAVERVLTKFRARFVGKVSPVHFFWGGFDLAVTRFSNRPAPGRRRVPTFRTPSTPKPTRMK
jgi:uncharacterized protein DUF5996